MRVLASGCFLATQFSSGQQRFVAIRRVSSDAKNYCATNQTAIPSDATASNIFVNGPGQTKWPRGISG